MITSHAWQLVQRPAGEPVPNDVALVEIELPAPSDGEVVVRNTFVSVDPYMRNRMNEGKSYVPPFALNAPMNGGAVGRVIDVRGTPDDATGRRLQVGDLVVHDDGWRTNAVLPGSACRLVAGAGLEAEVPEQAWLGVLGMPGLTAYAGLLRVGNRGAGASLAGGARHARPDGVRRAAASRRLPRWRPGVRQRSRRGGGLNGRPDRSTQGCLPRCGQRRRSGQDWLAHRGRRV